MIFWSLFIVLFFLIGILVLHILTLLIILFWVFFKRYELGRQPANTKLSSNKTVRRVRVRGGNVKWRALRLDTGNFSWGSEAVTRKTRLLDVVYNASNNELVRTQTLVKSAIVQVDAAPFKQWYLQYYGVEIGRKKKAAASAKKEAEVYFLSQWFFIKRNHNYNLLLFENIKLKVSLALLFNLFIICLYKVLLFEGFLC